MKIAVVTPYAGEDAETLARTLKSVAAQQLPEGATCHAVVVADGCAAPTKAQDEVDGMPVDTISLPQNSSSKGFGARAIGCTYAFDTLNADVIAHLDTGNEFTAGHCATLLHGFSGGAQVVSTLRVLVNPETREELWVDGADSDGQRFADPNTLAFAGPMRAFGSTWAWPALGEEYAHTGGDRNFWKRVLHSTTPEQRAHVHEPTVRYETRWLVHYNAQPNNKTLQPPERVKIVTQDESGKRSSAWVTPTTFDAEKGGWQWR